MSAVGERANQATSGRPVAKKIDSARINLVEVFGKPWGNHVRRHGATTN